MDQRLERWHKKIRAMSGQEKGSVFKTDPEPVRGNETLTVRYISVLGMHPTLQDGGVYVEYNISPEQYDSLPLVRRTLRSHVCLALMDEQKPRIDVGIGVELDHENAIESTDYFTTREGNVVRRIEPATLTRVDELLSAPGVKKTVVPVNNRGRR